MKKKKIEKKSYTKEMLKWVDIALGFSIQLQAHFKK